MASKQKLPIASTIVSRDGDDIGQFLCLNFGEGLEVADNGEAADVTFRSDLLVRPGYVIWRPESSSEGLYVQTWAEVQTAIALTSVPFVVYLDDSGTGDAFSVPGNSGITDCRGMTTFSVVAKSYAFSASLIINAGATLLDPTGFNRVNVSMACEDDIAACLDFSYGNQDRSLLNLWTSSLSLLTPSASGLPPISVPDGKYLVISCTNIFTDQVAITATGTYPVIGLVGSAELQIYLSGACGLSNSFMSAPFEGAVLRVFYDAGFFTSPNGLPHLAFPALPAMSGNIYWTAAKGLGPVPHQSPASIAATVVGGSFLVLDASSGVPFTVTLDSVSSTTGPMTVKCGTAAAVPCDITISGSGGILIEGAATQVLDGQTLFSRTYLLSPAGEWVVIASYL